MLSELQFYYTKLSQSRVFPGADLADSAYLDDDGTIDYVKRKNIYIPGNEVEIDRPLVSVPWRPMFSDEKCGIFLILGQSNAANHGEGSYRSRHRVFALDFMTLACHSAEDPLPGGSANGGSIWPRLGDLLVQSGLFESVLFILVAFGGSFVTDWSVDTAVQRRLTLTLSRLRKCLGMPFIPMNAVLWQQGEAEANHTSMPAATYSAHLRTVFEVIRRHGVFCPAFVAKATHCEAGEHPFNNHTAIREAQSEAADISQGIFPGPDIDVIQGKGRSDDCHLSALGLQQAAELWAEAIAAHAHLLGKGMVRDSVNAPRLAPAFSRRSDGSRHEDGGFAGSASLEPR